MTTTATVCTESFRVRSYETDPGGSASITTICNYLQEAAGSHAGLLGVSIEQLDERNLTWVLARLRVEMDVLPAWRDEVVVETWPSGVDRLFAMREFLLRDGEGAPVGRASSAWLMIDRERRRPIRMPDFITRLELPDRDKPIDGLPDSLPGVGDAASKRLLNVRYGDLDVNGHVNNVRYAEWSVGSVPADILDAYVVRTLDLHFHAEGNYEDAVTVFTERAGEEGDGPVFSHVIRRDDRELARARTGWAAR